MEVFDSDQYLKILKQNIRDLTIISQSINNKKKIDINIYNTLINRCRRDLIYILPVSEYSRVYIDFLKTDQGLLYTLESIDINSASWKEYINAYPNMIEYLFKILSEVDMHKEILKFIINIYKKKSTKDGITIIESKLTIGHIKFYIRKFYNYFWRECIKNIPTIIKIDLSPIDPKYPIYTADSVRLMKTDPIIFQRILSNLIKKTYEILENKFL
jgi:hypothetical protein